MAQLVQRRGFVAQKGCKQMSFGSYHVYVVCLPRLMERGSSVAMIPGAYQEATAFTYGRERVARNPPLAVQAFLLLEFSWLWQTINECALVLSTSNDF